MEDVDAARAECIVVARKYRCDTAAVTPDAHERFSAMHKAAWCDPTPLPRTFVALALNGGDLAARNAFDETPLRALVKKTRNIGRDDLLALRHDLDLARIIVH